MIVGPGLKQVEQAPVILEEALLARSAKSRAASYSTVIVLLVAVLVFE